MPAYRTPGPAGLHADADLTPFGFAVPGESGQHDLKSHLAGRGATRAEPTQGRVAPDAMIRRTRGAAQVPLLGVGSTGNDVRKLQALLNLRLSPSPALRVDGSFGPQTAAAVLRLQHAAAIRADGIAGKDTWRVLGNGNVFAGAAHGGSPAAAGAVGAGATAARPESPGAAAASAPIDEVLGWTAQRKFIEVSRRAVGRLPSATRDELLKLLDPTAIGITLAFWAASHLVGAGELIDAALLAAGLWMLGSAIFGVMEELGHFLLKTWNAGNHAELDEAANLLAHVIATIGVAALVAFLAKIRLKGGAAAGEGAAAAESEAAASRRAAPEPAPAKSSASKAPAPEVSKPKAVEEATTKRSTEPADKPGSQCAKEGCPISMVSGEEMLALDDFRWEGPLPLVWRRFYRSSFCDRAGLLGNGWLTTLDQWLQVGERVSFHNADGQRIDLPLPAPGSHSVNVPEGLRLYRDSGGFRIRPAQGPELWFSGQTGRCALTRWQDRAGPSIGLIRDADGRVTALAASWGRYLMLEYEQGRIVAIVPARRTAAGYQPTGAAHVRYQYDSQGDLVAARDRLNHGEQYAYARHLLTQRTLPGGFELRFEWDAADARARCLRSWGSDGIYDYRFEWLPGGVSRATDSRGGVTEYQHSPRAQLLRKRSPEGRETRYDYDPRNLLIRITDPEGQVTRHEHDADGRLTRIVAADGHEQRIDYDADGNATRWTDPMGGRWGRAHDARGRPVELRDPCGAITRWQYNAQGLLAVVEDALGRRRTLLWDGHMRLVGEVGFDGVRRRYQYDGDDRLTAMVTQDRLTHRQDYDAVGRLVAVHAADGRSVHLRHDAAGHLTHFTDAAGQTTTYRYEHGLSQISARIDPLGQLTRYEYDPERNLVALVNAKGERCELAYDRDENLVEEIGFDGRRQRYEYSPAGHLAAHLQRHGLPSGDDADWQRTAFERDTAGRLLRKRSRDGSESRYAYDSAGRLVAATNAEGRIEFRRDRVGRVLAEVRGNQVVSQAYDLLGRRTRLITPQGLRLDYRWDEHGHLSAIDLDGKPLSAHRYDELGREVARTQGAIATDFEHDEIGRLLRQQARRKDADPVIRRDYAYDAAGRLGAVDDLRSGTTRYLYDPADRLVEVQGLNPEHFVHDPAGNLLGDSAQAGQVRGDRLMMIGDRHFEYDEAGNRVEERRGTGGALVTRYAWDADHRLKRVETPNGVVEFHYDALGRRTRKRSSAGETRFVHVGLNLLSETGASETRTWVFEPSSFRPLAMIDDVGGAGAAGAGAGADAGGVPVGTEASRRISHYHLDHLGTPREMTDDTGRIVWSARPRAYGALALAEVNEVSNPLRFQGQYHDIETGLYYNLNRYYDPHTGRFLNQDPIGLAGGDNAYRYVPNPVNWVDPLGWVAKGGCGDAKPVEKYEVGTFDDLKSRSVVGDNLDIHHVTQKHAGGQVIPGYEQGSAPAIALPRGEHSRIPTIKGEYTESARDLLANDIRNLRDYTSTPNSSLRDLIDLNKTMYPDSFGK